MATSATRFEAPTLSVATAGGRQLARFDILPMSSLHGEVEHSLSAEKASLLVKVASEFRATTVVIDLGPPSANSPVTISREVCDVLATSLATLAVGTAGVQAGAPDAVANNAVASLGLLVQSGAELTGFGPNFVESRTSGVSGESRYSAALLRADSARTLESELNRVSTDLMNDSGFGRLRRAGLMRVVLHLSVRRGVKRGVQVSQAALGNIQRLGAALVLDVV